MAKKLYYKIGEACKLLDIQPYVLRYWETEFPFLEPSKSKSGQRTYSPQEVEVIRRIKELLYEEGYTIAGAKKKLEAELANPEPKPAAKAAPKAAPKAKKRAAKKSSAGTKSAQPEVTKAALAGEKLDGDQADGATGDGATVDSATAEKMKILRSGIEEALRRAREILDLLDASTGSPQSRTS